MDSNERREMVLKDIMQSKSALSARSLAKIYSVSRQIIVGDVALLRAEGYDIVATAKGYVYGDPYPHKIRKIVAVQHNHQQTQAELELFVSAQVIVENVIVEHPIYGEIRGNLNIKSQEDIEHFMQGNPPLLSSLTDGIHLHTILVDDEKHFKDLMQRLRNEGFLY